MIRKALNTPFPTPGFAEPLLLIRNGRLIRRNLKRLLISPEELMAKLRGLDVRTLSSVSVCMLNPDGEVNAFIAS